MTESRQIASSYPMILNSNTDTPHTQIHGGRYRNTHDCKPLNIVDWTLTPKVHRYTQTVCDLLNDVHGKQALKLWYSGRFLFTRYFTVDWNKLFFFLKLKIGKYGDFFLEDMKRRDR